MGFINWLFGDKETTQKVVHTPRKRQRSASEEARAERDRQFTLARQKKEMKRVNTSAPQRAVAVRSHSTSNNSSSSNSDDNFGRDMIIDNFGRDMIIGMATGIPMPSVGGIIGASLHTSPACDSTPASNYCDPTPSSCTGIDY